MIEQQVTANPRPATRRSARVAAGQPLPATGRPRRRIPGSAGWSGWAVRAPLPVALALWLVALPRVRLDRMGDLGLLQALPVPYWLALIVLTIGFSAALRDKRLPQRWLACYVLGLIAMIHATPSLLYPTLRYSWAWKHVAIVDAVLRHNGTVPNAHDLDIYNQWPGFFQLNALFLRATGLHSAVGYASWYPVLANVLLMGPLLLIYRTFTRDRRLIWGGVWLYFATSWIGQDYFSPQAFAYLLFLTVLALVLRRVAAVRRAGAGPRAKGKPGAPDDKPAAADAKPPDGHPAAPPQKPGARALSSFSDSSPRGGWRPASFALVLILTAAIVTSHPLTPLMLISALALLSLPRGNRPVVLPALAAAVGMTLLWNSTVARPYVSQHIGDLVAALGAPDRNAVSGFAALGQAAPYQVLASWVDRGLTATVLLLAAVAVVRHRWVRRTALPLLMLAPMPLLLGNPYGGEMIFRAYLFALPAAAFLVATLIVPTRALPRTGMWIPLPIMLALLAGLLCGYYSKDDMYHFTPQEVAAAAYVARTAPPGAQVVSVTADVPGADQRYDEHVRTVLAQRTVPDRQALLNDPDAVLEATMSDPRVTGPSYLILTRAQVAECRMTGVLPTDTVERLRDAAAISPNLRPVFIDGDSIVYRHVTTVAGQGPFRSTS